MKTVGPHSLATRKTALRKIAKGERPAEVCRQMGIDPKTLRTWRKAEAEGRIPGTPIAPLIPVDEAPEALAMPQGKLAEVLALTMPAGTPRDLWKNAMMQKLATAMQDSPIPVPTKISEWRQLMGMASELMELKGAAGKKGGMASNLNIRLDILGKQPRIAGMSVVEAEEVLAESEEDSE